MRGRGEETAWWGRGGRTLVPVVPGGAVVAGDDLGGGCGRLAVATRVGEGRRWDGNAGGRGRECGSNLALV